MIKKERKTEIKPKELTAEEKVEVLKKEIEDLKVAMDDMILNGGLI
jgi:anti-sigma28 factor (negative regulator of flagellin synthesis)